MVHRAVSAVGVSVAAQIYMFWRDVMKKTGTGNRKNVFLKAARSASVLALALMLGACSSKRGDDNNETTAAVVGGETSAEAVVTTAQDVTTTAAANEVTNEATTAANEATTEATSTETEAATDAGTDPKETDPETTEAPTTVDRSEFIVPLASIEVSDYIDLSKLQNLEVKKSDTVVNEEKIKYEVAAALVSELGFELEEKDRPAEFGDTVTIDYEGYLDDVKFDGGSAQDHDLGIGSGQFIPGFEEGIVGKKAGDAFDLPLTFPENYHSEDLAGKDTVFKVTIKKVMALPEITDEMIREKSQGYYKSYKEYYDSIANDYNRSARENAVFNAIMDAIEVKEENEGLINEYVQSQMSRLNQLCAAYGIDVATYLSLSGYTEEQFNESLRKYGSEYAKQKLAIIAICRQEGYTISEDEVKEYITTTVRDNNLESEEYLLSVMTRDEIEFELLYEKFMNYVDNFKTVD